MHGFALRNSWAKGHKMTKIYEYNDARPGSWCQTGIDDDKKTALLASNKPAKLTGKIKSEMADILFQTCYITVSERRYLGKKEKRRRRSCLEENPIKKTNQSA